MWGRRTGGPAAVTPLRQGSTGITRKGSPASQVPVFQINKVHAMHYYPDI